MLYTFKKNGNDIDHHSPGSSSLPQVSLDLPGWRGNDCRTANSRHAILGPRLVIGRSMGKLDRACFPPSLLPVAPASPVILSSIAPGFHFSQGGLLAPSHQTMCCLLPTAVLPHNTSTRQSLSIMIHMEPSSCPRDQYGTARIVRRVHYQYLHRRRCPVI